MRERVRRTMGAAVAAAALATAGTAPAHAAGNGAVTEGNQPYKVEICYDDMLGNKLCTTMEGRALQVVLPNGRQLNRDRGTHVSEGYTKDGVYYTESGAHNSFTVYEEYVSPWEWDDQVTRVDTTTTYYFETGETCVLTQTFVQVDDEARNQRTDVVCS